MVQGLILSLLPAGAAFAGPVNLNSADAATLARELDGIGPAKAQAIVEFRQKNGPFKTPEDLLKVRGHRRTRAGAEPRQHPPERRRRRTCGRPAKPAPKPASRPAPQSGAER